MARLTHTALIPTGCHYRLMEFMLLNILCVTCRALHGSDILFVRHIVRIKAGVTGNAGKFLVRGIV